MVFSYTWQWVLDGTKTRTMRVNIPVWLRPGKVVAVQPGPGQSAAGGVRITKIGRQCPCELSEEEILQEGIPASHDPVARRVLWRALSGAVGLEWDVSAYVIEFERVD